MRTKISEFSATPSDNTDIDGIDIAEGCAPSGINNAIRELMAQLKDMQTGASGDTFTLTTINSTTVDTTNLEATNLKAKDGTAAGSIANSTGVVTLGSSVLTTTDINGGTVDGTAIGATTPSTVVATQVDITAQGDLRLQDTTGGQYVALQAPGTIATSYTLTLPVDDGTAGQALITDGSGVLSWSTAASGDVYGPASATDNAVARYDSTTGKIIQNSAVTIADDGATVIAANSSSDALRITQVGTGNALTVEDSANPDATPFVVEASGDVLIGTATAIPGAFSDTGKLQIVNNTGEANQTNFTFLNSSGGSIAYFNKSRSGTVGTNTIVQSGDVLGDFVFAGADGTTYQRAAQITAAVDGTPGTSDMPGRLVFSTTADGASSPTERMRIDSAGRVGIGGTATTGEMLALRNTAETTATVFGFRNVSNVNQATTTTAYGITDQTQILSPAALTNLFRFRAAAGSFSGTVTNQYGYAADSTLTGATNNYGFYSNIASGTGRWNFYAAGTADNYFAGNVAVGTTTTSIAKLFVSAGNIATDQSVLSRVSSGLANGSRGFRGLIDGTEYFALYNDNTNTVLSAFGTTRINVINSSGVISLGAAPGAESLRVTPVASAVNYLNVNGAPTSGFPSIQAQGSDTNISIAYTSKGTGANEFYTNNFSQRQFVIAHTASAVNYLQVTGGATGGGATLSAQGSDVNVPLNILTKGTGYFNFSSGGGTQFLVGHTASPVNYLRVAGAGTSGVPSISALGSDANISIGYSSQGVAAHYFYTRGLSSLGFSITDVGSAVNYLQASGNSTGSSPTLTAVGSDTNIDLALTPKGTGNVRFGTLTANADAPITGYILIKDSAGTTRKLAVIA